jgi:hypothetical protein
MIPVIEKKYKLAKICADQLLPNQGKINLHRLSVGVRLVS